MRSIVLSVMLVVLYTAQVQAQQATQVLTPPGGTPVGDAASYGIGFEVGMNLASRGLTAEDLKQADFFKGLEMALAGKDPAIPVEQIGQAMQGLIQRILQRKAAAAAKYLEENKKKDGVQVTESGLQYQVLKTGSGAVPNAGSTVTVHYEGKLIDGQIFDSSVQRGQPTSFGVSQVIPGWTEALLRMKVGDKWKLVIPPKLAYGEQGSPPRIGPNEALIFEVELLEVN